MRKILLALVALAAVSNAGMIDAVTSKATDVIKEKAQNKATDMAKDQAKKSLTDGSMKDKAIDKVVEVADDHTDGKASQVVDVVKEHIK
jgi:ABC-type transporter MlaC component